MTPPLTAETLSALASTLANIRWSAASAAERKAEGARLAAARQAKRVLRARKAAAKRAAAARARAAARLAAQGER